MDVGDIETLDVDRASPDQLRAAAAKWRRLGAETASKYAWTDQYRPKDPPGPRSTLASMVSNAKPPTAEELQERGRRLRQAKAMVAIELELEKEAAVAASAAQTAKDEADARFRRSAIGGLFGR
jgi:hypothetical protein